MRGKCSARWQLTDLRSSMCSTRDPYLEDVFVSLVSADQDAESASTPTYLSLGPGRRD